MGEAHGELFDLSHYDELLALAKGRSDHEDKVVELEPAIVESLAATDPRLPVLEIGVRQGGSSLLIVAHIEKEGKGRGLVSVDADPSAEKHFNEVVKPWAEKVGAKAWFGLSSQELFVKNTPDTYGFIYLDADHEERTVERDIEILIPHLAKGGIMAVDDVEAWSSLPEYPGLERVDYTEAWKKLGFVEHWQPWRSGHHFIAYRRV